MKPTLRTICYMGIGTWLLGSSTACTQQVDTNSVRRARAFYRIGVKQSNKGRYREALAALTRASELNPNDYWIREATGGTLLRMGFAKKALTHYRKALDIEPKSPRGWNNLGTAHMALGEWKQAIFAFRRSLKNIMYQTPCFSQMNLGWAYHKNKEHDNARKYLFLATRTCPRLCQGYRLYGIAMYQQRSFKKAQENFQELTKRCEKFPTGHYWLAKTHIAQKHFHAALSPLRECITRSQKVEELRNQCRKMMSTTQRNISGTP